MVVTKSAKKKYINFLPKRSYLFLPKTRISKYTCNKNLNPCISGSDTTVGVCTVL
jgi:hypothetical protein